MSTMTEHNDDLRGSTPVYSAKEILVGLDKKVDTISDQMTILVSQDLNTRVTVLEGFRERIIGVSTIGAVLGTLGTIIGVLALLKPVAP